jgi:hypothetical protein
MFPRAVILPGQSQARDRDVRRVRFLPHHRGVLYGRALLVHEELQPEVIGDRAGRQAGRDVLVQPVGKGRGLGSGFGACLGLQGVADRVFAEADRERAVERSGRERKERTRSLRHAFPDEGQGSQGAQAEERQGQQERGPRGHDLGEPHEVIGIAERRRRVVDEEEVLRRGVLHSRDDFPALHAHHLDRQAPHVFFGIAGAPRGSVGEADIGAIGSRLAEQAHAGMFGKARQHGKLRGYPASRLGMEGPARFAARRVLLLDRRQPAGQAFQPVVFPGGNHFLPIGRGILRHHFPFTLSLTPGRPFEVRAEK